MSALDAGNVVEANLDRLCFPGTRLPRDKDGLVHAFAKGQSLVGEGRGFVDVRLHHSAGVLGRLFPDETVRVVASLFLSVEFMVPLVGVDGDDDVPGASVRFLANVSELQVVENRGLKKLENRMSFVSACVCIIVEVAHSLIETNLVHERKINHIHVFFEISITVDILHGKDVIGVICHIDDLIIMVAKRF